MIDPAVAAVLWPALVFGSASAALLWLLGLSRLRGALAAGVIMASLFGAGQWPAAILGVAALALAGAVGRLAEAVSEAPASPAAPRLSLRATLAIAGPAAVLAWTAALIGSSTYAWVAAIAALSGGVAVWSGVAMHQARPETAGIDRATAAGAALAVAALARQQHLLGPGDGIALVVAALVALPLARRASKRLSVRVAIGSLVSAGLAAGIVRLLP